MSSTEKDGEDFAAMFEESEQSPSGSQAAALPAVGDTVSGSVVSISNDAVFVSLGAKAEAVLDRDQVLDAVGQLTVAVGDTVEARVVEIRGDQVILRQKSLGSGPAAKSELQQAHELSLPVEGQVSGVIKGGVEVQVAGQRAFCPISQLDNRFVEDPSVFVGQTLQFRIIRYEAGRGPHVNIVLSRRVLREEEAAKRATETRARLEKGAVFTGEVIAIKGYGAFVDLGGIEGMLHISELSFTRVEHPSEVVSVGQEVQVQVIKIEKTNNPKRPEKIGLSMKALAKNPWDSAFAELHEGMQLQGKVMRIQPFGAFVEVRPGVEGLVHISEMSGRRIQHPRDVVSEGDVVDVVILALDPGRRRISLSMSELSRMEEARDVAEYQARQDGDGGGGGGRRDGRGGRGGRGGRRDGGRRDGGRDSGGGRRDSGGGAKFGTLGDLLKFKKR